MKYLIGVDIGTTGTKAALYDTEGMLLAEAYRESSLHFPCPGWVEQDPKDFYKSACDTIREVADQSCIDKKQIAAIGFDGQMAGILGIDENWHPVTHYDSWLDMRCKKYVEYIRKSHEEKVILLSGLPSTVAHCAKILWWQHEMPDIYAKIKKFIQPAAYVAGKLAGLRGSDAFIDHTYLHFTGLYDAGTTQWSQALCNDFDIPIEKLPRIMEPWNIIGTITGKASADCGLPAGIPIAAGMGDQAAGFLGAGLVEPGMVVDVAGTASVFACCVDAFRPDIRHKTLLFPKAASKGLWFPHAYIAGGGLCLRWFRDGFIKPDPTDASSVYQRLDEVASGVPAGSDAMFFIPHLGGRGYPNDSTARGVFAGFSWNNERKHFYRAMLESIAYEYQYYLSIEKELFPEVAFREVRVIGGGAKSRLFNQIKADVLGIPYVTMEREEVACLGGAINAGHAVGIYADMEAAARTFTTIRERIEPDMKMHEFYRPYVQLYREMFGILAPFYQKLAELPRQEGPLQQEEH